MTRYSRWLVILCGAAAVAILVVAQSRPSPLTVVQILGYEGDQRPEAAVAFSGNDLIFEAEVVRQGEVRMTKPAVPPPDGLPPFAYTPIEVTVLRVYRGDLEVGQTMTVRHLGGAFGGTEYVFDGFTAIGAYESEARLLLFTESVIDAGDGLAAATPNFAYVIADGVLRAAADPSIQDDLSRIRSLLSVTDQ